MIVAGRAELRARSSTFHPAPFSPSRWVKSSPLMFRPSACISPRGGGQVLVDVGDHSRALAHGGGQALARAAADVAGGEHARQAGLEREGGALERPVGPGAREVAVGEQEAV